MLIPGASIRPRRLSFYMLEDGPRRTARRGTVAPKLSGEKAYARIQRLSRKSQDRISSYVCLLLDSAKSKSVYEKATGKHFRFKINFVTLTLPSKQIHSDREIHNKVFKDFIRACKRKHHSFAYLYKAEVQDNGNLHYHLITNCFLHWRWLRDTWNLYCNSLGYLDRCKVSDPNSTDVHAVHKLKNPAAYICKYITKGDCYSKLLQRYHRRFDKRLKNATGATCEIPKNYFAKMKRKPDVKLWDCSKCLKIGHIKLQIPPEAFELEAQQMLDHGAKFIRTDHAGLVCFTYEQLMATNWIKARYLEFIANLRAMNDLIPADSSI